MPPHATGPTGFPSQQPRDYSWVLFASALLVIGLWLLYLAIAVLEFVVQLWAISQQEQPLIPPLPSIPFQVGWALFLSPSLGLAVPMLLGGVLLLTRPAAVRKLAQWWKDTRAPWEAAVHFLWFGAAFLAIFVFDWFHPNGFAFVSVFLMSTVAGFPRLLVWILRRRQPR